MVNITCNLPGYVTMSNLLHTPTTIKSSRTPRKPKKSNLADVIELYATKRLTNLGLRNLQVHLWTIFLASFRSHIEQKLARHNGLDIFNKPEVTVIEDSS